MYTIRTFVQNCTQPKGGYLPVKNFKQSKLEVTNTIMSDADTCTTEEAQVVRLLLAVLNNKPASEVFRAGIQGLFCIRKELPDLASSIDISFLLTAIHDLTDESIRAAYKLNAYASCLYIHDNLRKHVTNLKTEINDAAVNNIRTMVERTQQCIKQVGYTKVETNVQFTSRTARIYKGGADCICDDTLLNIYCITKNINAMDTFQTYIASYMATLDPYDIKRIAIYNPRLNILYTYNLDELEQSVKDEIQHIL